MKIINKHYLLAVILILFIKSNAFSQDPETHYITLHVNTSVVDNQNASEVSNFGQEEGISNEDFTISVRLGDTIIWRGLSSVSEDDEVFIESINYEGGVNIFNRNILRSTRENPGLVIGTAVVGNVGDMIKYKVSFTVSNNGVKRQGTFHIDPKIRLKN